MFTGGKSDEKLIIPLNDSISGTLDMEQMCATTSVALSAQFTSNRMWLNGEEVDMTANARLLRCIEEGKDNKKGREQLSLKATKKHTSFCSENHAQSW